MNSGWIITLNNGKKIICDEFTYAIYKQFVKNEDIQSEVHWEDLQECIKCNPDAVEPEI